jgi:hypothetical protein
MSARTGLGEDNVDRTTVAGQPAQDSWGRIAKTRQLGYISQDRSDWTDREDAQHMTARI